MEDDAEGHYVKGTRGVAEVAALAAQVALESFRG